MNNISNLSLLKYFYDAATNGSVAASALINHVSQPAVSQGIRKLEEQLGVELMNHHQRIFKLTSEGQYLVENAAEIFNKLSELESQIGRKSKALSGRLTIATSQALATHCVAKALGKLRAQAPLVRPLIKLGKTTGIKQAVKDRQADVGVAIEKGPSQGFETHVICSGHFVVIGPKKFDLPIADSPFIVTEERNEIIELKDAYLKRFKRELPVEMIVESWSVISSFVESGLGLGLVPDFVANQNPKLQIIPGFPKPSYKVCVYYKSKAQLSPAAEAFLKNLCVQLQ